MCTSLYELFIVFVVCEFEGVVTSIAVDDVNGFVYWGDVTFESTSSKKTIKRATINGDDITVIVDAGKLRITWYTCIFDNLLTRVKYG